MPDQPPKDMMMSGESVIDDALLPQRSTGPVLLGVAVFGLLVAGSIALWTNYGTAVFFEMIRAGFIACFG